MVKKSTKKIDSNPVAFRLVELKDLGLHGSENKTVSKMSFAVSIRVLLNQWRQGTVACKGRADVARSGKKPWKQKGTGRARAGTARSPLWRGGGVIHGPQARVRVLSVNKKARKAVFEGLINDRVHNKSVFAVDWLLNEERPKTKYTKGILHALQIESERVIVFLNQNDHLHYASFANLNKVQIVFFDEPNVYHLSVAKKWVFLEKDTEQFKQMVSRWL